jgi:hypothetical protein
VAFSQGDAAADVRYIQKGTIAYNGGLKINRPLLSVVLHV